MPPITISKNTPTRSTSQSRSDPAQLSKSEARNSTGTAAGAVSTAQSMAEKDLESIGRHCEFAFCRQLDFLPFRCESCRGTFCLEHRTETAHRCPKEGEGARRRARLDRGQDSKSSSSSSSPSPSPPMLSGAKPNIYNSDQCAHLTCKTLVNTLKDPGVTCPDCRRQFCLKHRLREEHGCRPAARRQGLASGPGYVGGGNESMKSIFARLRTWGKDKSASKAKPNANSPAARIAQVNALKKSAKGDASVPNDRRVYLHVASASDTQVGEAPNGDFFYDVKWKVGRVLDDAARRLGVENINNRGGGEATRLRIFHVEGGEFLEFSDEIGGKAKNGHTIVLLRGAGVMLDKTGP